MNKKLSILIITLLAVVQSFALNFTATVNTKTVAVGQRFQITFAADASIDNFKAPSFDGFQILSGPNQSSSTQYANGKWSSSVSYSYILVATKVGSLTIDAASCFSDDKSYSSNPIKITVGKNANNAGAANQQQQPKASKQAKQQAGKDLFVTASPSKRTAYVGEPIALTFKIYTRLSLSNITDFKPASLNGFWKKDIEVKQIQLKQENLNGVAYNAAVISQFLLYPQKSGKVVIDPFELTAIVQQRSQNRQPRSIFDQFFGSVEEVEMKIKSKPIIINVKPLPKGKPADFNGAVGSFNLDVKTSKNKIKANEAIDLKVRIGGKGNLNLVSFDELNFPSDFETYDPKINDNLSTNLSGTSGAKEWNYLVIPRHEGNFEIDPISFSYFDLKSKNYKTLKSQPIKIEVTPSEGGYQNQVFSSTNKKEIKEIGNDIRYIHTATPTLLTESYFYGSWKFYFLLLLAPLLFIAALLYRNKYRAELADVKGLKRKKAGKMASKHLAIAKQSLAENNTNAFYEDISKALYGYLSDKLNLEISELNKATIQNSLEKTDINNNTITELNDTLSHCEMARFAPSANVSENDIYAKAESIINKIEEEFKG